MERHGSYIAACLVACGMGFWAPAKVAAEPYMFDKGHTLIVFSWNHLGMTRQQGRVNGYDGTFDIDPGDPEKAVVEVTMRVNSLQTGVDALDRILRSSDYFDAARFPVMSFKSTSVRRTSDTTAEITGDLTVRNVSRPVTLNARLTFGGAHPLATVNPAYTGKRALAFSATVAIKRSDFEITRGTPMVSDDIEIAIETELISRD